MEKCLISYDPLPVERRLRATAVPLSRVRVGQRLRGMDGIPARNRKTLSQLASHHQSCVRCRRITPHRHLLVAAADDLDLACVICSHCCTIVELEPDTAPALSRECEFSI